MSACDWVGVSCVRSRFAKHYNRCQAYFSLNMKNVTRSLSLLGLWVLLLLGNSTVFCEDVWPLNHKYLNANWTSKDPRPPVPVWPDQFTSDFYVYVEIYGEDFQSKGAIVYDWTKKVSCTYSI